MVKTILGIPDLWYTGKVECSICHRYLGQDSPGTYKLIEGWVEVRKQGGGHSIVMPSTPKAFAHRQCIEAKKNMGEQQSWMLE